jgi:spore germination protein GerM
MSTLKRRLGEYRLKRKNAVDDNDIAQAIEQELQGPSSVSGYRSM